MEIEPHFQKPFTYAEIDAAAIDGLILPGGHAPGMRLYLEDETLQELTATMLADDRPLGAICHGVLVAARARDPQHGGPALAGRKVTALTATMELSAWLMTGLWLGSYFRTYPETVESETRRALGSKGQFHSGPLLPRRDSKDRPGRGYVVVDGQLVTARWPGDAHRFGRAFLEVAQSSLSS